MAKERLGVSGGTGNHNHCSREASGTSRGFTLSLGPFPVAVSGSGTVPFLDRGTPRDARSGDVGHGTHCRGILDRWRCGHGEENRDNDMTLKR